VNQVKAESTRDKAPIPTVAGGGLLGILAGPLGIAIGLTAGAISGGVLRSKDKEAAKHFNSNYI
jgi:outer membrane lipoprotein SlyB